MLQEQEDKSWEKELWLCHGYAMARPMDSYAVPITRLSYSQAIAVGQRSVNIHLVVECYQGTKGQFHSGCLLKILKSAKISQLVEKINLILTDKQLINI